MTSEYHTDFVKPLASVSPREINEVLIEITQKLKRSPKIVRASAFAETTEVEVHFVSTNGSDATQRFTYITADFEATAREGNIVQRRTAHGFRGKSRQGGWEQAATGHIGEHGEFVPDAQSPGPGNPTNPTTDRPTDEQVTPSVG